MCFIKWQSQPPSPPPKIPCWQTFVILAWGVLTPLWALPNANKGWSQMLKDRELCGGHHLARQRGTFIYLQLPTLSLEAGKDSRCCRPSEPEHWRQRSLGKQHVEGGEAPKSRLVGKGRWGGGGCGQGLVEETEAAKTSCCKHEPQEGVKYPSLSTLAILKAFSYRSPHYHHHIHITR